mmetsp:Transcript_6999/g.16552  ORF Transcript_6999/g.16552 Transcript_6999/m.16552 type:complete len:248 (+) Transcript_6999:993-1736(+)
MPPSRFASFPASESRNLSSASNSSTFRVSPKETSCVDRSSRWTGDPETPDLALMPPAAGAMVAPGSALLGSGVEGAGISILGRWALGSASGGLVGPALLGELGAVPVPGGCSVAWPVPGRDPSCRTPDCVVPGRDASCRVPGRDRERDCCVPGRLAEGEPAGRSLLPSNARICAFSASSVAVICDSSSSISSWRRASSACLISASSLGMSWRCRMTSQRPWPAASSRTRSQRNPGMSASTFFGRKRV